MATERTKRQRILLGIQAGLVTLMALLALLQAFVDSPTVKGVTGVYLLIIIALFWPFVKGAIKYLSLALFIIGASILIINGSSAQVWLSSLSINHMLVALFVTTPLLGIPFQTADFLQALKGLYSKYIHSPTLFSALTQVFTHLMAVVLNIGAASIFYYLSSSNPYVQSNRLISAALIRGFAGAITWSPFFAAMALMISQLPIEWKTILPFSLGFVAVTFLVSIVMEWLYIRKNRPGDKAIDEVALESAADDEEQTVNWKKILELVLLLLGIMAIVFLFEEISELSMIAVVIMTAYLYPFIVLAIKKQFSLIKTAGKQYLTKTLPDKKKEIVLFLLIGFFSGAVAETPFGEWLANILTSIFGDFTFGISLFIALSLIIISSFGFHPIMVVTLYVTSVDPLALDMSVNYFAVLLLGAWGIATTVSPMTAINFMMASFMKEKLTTTTIKWNALYSSVALVLLLAYLSVLTGMHVI